MASGLQDIPLRRIPKEWDRQWFADFVRDVLRLADARNIKVGPELDLTGQSDEVASLNMSVGGIGLDKIAPQPGLSVIGNPTDSTGVLQALVASLDLQVVRRSGLAVGFGVLNATYISDFTEAAQDAVGLILTDTASIDFAYDDALGTISAVVLPAGVDHNTLANLTTGDPHTQYPLAAGVETIGGTWTFSNTVGAPAVNGATTLQLQAGGTTFQYFTATQTASGLTTSIPATSTTRYVFGVSGNQGIEIAALAGSPRWVAKRYNGAYASPTKVVNTNTLNLIRTEGYQETTPAFAAYATLDVIATEDWTSTANGHKVTLRSTVNGSTTASATLLLQGTQAQFLAGTVTVPSATFQTDLLSGLYLIGALNIGVSINSTKVFDWSATAATLTTLDLKLASVGKGIYIKEGTNACMGVATLVAGTVVVSTNKVTASSRIFLTVQSLGTVALPTAVCVTARTAATSFTITSASVTDTSVVAWHILEPA